MNDPKTSSASVLCFVAAIVCACATARAGLGPENVAVVVNENSWASKAIANHYVKLRNIPARNVIYLDMADMGDFEITTVSRFRQRILTPTLDAIKARGLTKQIDCVAWSSDIPYAVQFGQDSKGTHTTGSLTGLTFLYQAVIEKKGYASTTANRYFRRPIRPRPAPWKPDDSRLITEANQALAKKQYDEAEGKIKKVLPSRPKDGMLYFRLAQCRAAKRDASGAMALLFQAAENNYRSARSVQATPEFKSLETHKDYKRLIARMSQPVQYKDIDIQPTAAFHNRYAWDPRGNIVAEDKGTRYMLSTMLGVTSGRGSSVRQVLENLRRSAAADGRNPKGTIYFMVNRDVRSKTRQWGVPAVIDKLARIGVRGVAVQGTLPTGKADVMGLAAGSAHLNIAKAGMSILPGAICENLTSWGGVMHQWGGQTPLTAFTNAGAAASSGTVVEPYAIQNKFPSPFIHYIYAQGFTLAEAYYQSVHGPYQLLIVGDPLCKPWGKMRRVNLEGLQTGQEVTGALPVKPTATLDGDKVRSFEIYVDGRWVASFPPGKSTHMGTDSGADGYHELRCVAIGTDPTRTCVSQAIGFTVNNHGHKVLAMPAGATSVPLGAKIGVSAIAEGATKLTLKHNHRELATVQGAKASFSVDSDRLGMGPVRLEVEAEFPGEKKTWRVSGTPLVFTVKEPPVLPPDRVGTHLAKGLKLTIPGKSSLAGIGLLKQDPKKMNLAAGDAWTLEGVLTATKNGVYQLQVRPGKTSSLKFGSRTIPLDENKTGWQFIPLRLVAGGKYRIVAKGKATGGRLPDIRFGLFGPRTLSTANTQH